MPITLVELTAINGGDVPAVLEPDETRLLPRGDGGVKAGNVVVCADAVCMPDIIT